MRKIKIHTHRGLKFSLGIEYSRFSGDKKKSNRATHQGQSIICHHAGCKKKIGRNTTLLIDGYPYCLNHARNRFIEKPEGYGIFNTEQTIKGIKLYIKRIAEGMKQKEAYKLFLKGE